MTFNEKDLNELDEFLSRFDEVIPYIEVSRGLASPGTLAMRHDVDHSIEKAVRFAAWECERGYRSTYFVLHSAPYYQSKTILKDCLNELIVMGHEVGFHNDALCATDGNPIAAAELITTERLAMQSLIERHYSILGVADHGGSPHTNGDIWSHYTTTALGFEYEAYQLQKEANTYISDNQGAWRSPLKHAQTFMLIHPTWWPV